MDPSTIQNTIDPMVPENLRAPEKETKDTKKPKTAIWILSILSVVAIATAGVFAYLYFNNQNSYPVEDTEEIVDVSEEVDITDPDIIDDLDKKIAILFGTDNTDPTFATSRSIGYNDEVLFHEGDITQTAKIVSIINHTLESRPLSEEEIVAAINQSGFTGEDEETFRQYFANGYDGDLVAQKYKEIFGEDLVKGQMGEFCGSYAYNNQYDFYYSDVFGCGGTTPYERFYYKNRYTKDENHAYVYVSTAFMSPEDVNSTEEFAQEKYNVYCDVAYLNSSNTISQVADDAEICATLDNYDEALSFTLDASNYEKYSNYRFVFNRSDDGNYYFDKVEKL